MAERGVLIGIDLGTTVLKVCAFDAKSGKLLGQASKRLDVRVFSDGRREQNPAYVTRAFRQAVVDVQSQTGRAWKRVEGIGLASQGGSTIMARRGDGRALTPMILWNDARSGVLTAQVAAMKSRAYWRGFILREAPVDGLGRLLWLKQNRPKLLVPENIHVGAGEYLYFAMTGVWRQDAGNAIQMGSYNASRERLDSAALDLVDVPLFLFAPLRRGHETSPLTPQAAALMGLPAGIPVAGPYIDQEAGYMSALGVSARPLQCSLGTAWVGNFVLPDGAKGYSPSQLAIPSPVGSGRLVIQPLACGNVTWDWGLEHLVDADHSKALAKASAMFLASLLPHEGLVALPWFTRPNPLRLQANGAGSFWGVGARTSKADLLRALAAGMVFELARMFSEVKDSGVVDTLVINGGAGRGRHFHRLISALFGPLPIHLQIDGDAAAARGALFAFGLKAARNSSGRLPVANARERTKVLAAYEQYLEVLGNLRESAGGPAFHFDES